VPQLALRAACSSLFLRGNPQNINVFPKEKSNENEAGKNFCLYTAAAGVYDHLCGWW
jgi:hypothetical protein